MKKELQEKLFEKYPKIFRQKDLDMTETAMCWGIACGDGWYWLIDRLCSNLQWNTDNNNRPIKGDENNYPYPQVEAVQVKEKFGGLRFYVGGATDRQHAVINFAEALSYTICENCGSTEEVEQTKGGWIQSLCKKCREKEN